MSICSVYFEVGHVILYTIFIVVVVDHFLLLQLATFNSMVVVDRSVVVDSLIVVVDILYSRGGQLSRR